MKNMVMALIILTRSWFLLSSWHGQYGGRSWKIYLGWPRTLWSRSWFLTFLAARCRWPAVDCSAPAVRWSSFGTRVTCSRELYLIWKVQLRSSFFKIVCSDSDSMSSAFWSSLYLYFCCCCCCWRLQSHTVFHEKLSKAQIVKGTMDLRVECFHLSTPQSCSPSII